MSRCSATVPCDSLPAAQTVRAMTTREGERAGGVAHIHDESLESSDPGERGVIDRSSDLIDGQLLELRRRAQRREIRVLTGYLPTPFEHRPLIGADVASVERGCRSGRATSLPTMDDDKIAVYLDDVRAKIDTHGHAVQQVAGNDGAPGWSYTPSGFTISDFPS